MSLVPFARNVASLQELLPDANPLQLRRIAPFMKEGKAARGSDIESVSPNLWLQLEKRLEEPQYFRRRFAVQKLLSLRILRNLFIGKVIHTSKEQWKKDVTNLLSFNVSAQGDFAKWRRR